MIFYLRLLLCGYSKLTLNTRLQELESDSVCILLIQI